jgi:hypothetical protein
MEKLSPVFNEQTVDINGNPLSGAKVFTYAAGSSTKVATFTNAAGTIPQTNPIILDALGYPTNGSIWLAEGTLVKFVLAPSTDTDPPTSPIRTIDNVQGVNDSSTTVSQWTASGTAPTYVNATTFTLAGDQTSAFQPGRREQFTVSAGTVYGDIVSSSYAALTTVVMQMDTGQVLDSGLSAVNHSILLTTPTAIPAIFTNDITTTKTFTLAGDPVSPLEAATKQYVDGRFVLTTAVALSGTAIDFTGIPSWVTRIRFLVNAASGNGVSALIFQLGTASGIETSGYTGTVITLSAGANSTANYGVAFGTAGTAATQSRSGDLVLSKISPATNLWIASGILSGEDAAYQNTMAGRKSLAGVLDRVRITWSNGVDVFDAGSVSITYE